MTTVRERLEAQVQAKQRNNLEKQVKRVQEDRGEISVETIGATETQLPGRTTTVSAVPSISDLVAQINRPTEAENQFNDSLQRTVDLKRATIGTRKGPETIGV